MLYCIYLIILSISSKMYCEIQLEDYMESGDMHFNVSVRSVGPYCNYTVTTRESYYLQIACNRYDKVDRLIDSTIQQYDGDFTFIALVFKEAAFPNATLTGHWYTGQQPMDALEFHYCDLHIIHSDAFELEVFHRLVRIKFLGLDQLEIQFQYGQYLHLRQLQFYYSTIENMAMHFLEPLHRFLSVFYITLFPPDITFKHLLGNAQLMKLEQLSIFGVTSTITRSLHRSNFTKLICIQLLQLQDCNIDTIHPETFDFIGDTLYFLDLTSNKLTTVDPLWFQKFLDTNCGFYKMLQYNFNPVQCNCNFYALQNLTIYLRTYTSVHNAISQALRATCLESDQMAECDNLQTLSRDKLFLTNESVIPQYAYPKVNLRLRSDILYAFTTFKMKFRLLILSHERIESRKQTKCVSPAWIRDSIKCLLVPGDKKAIRMVPYLRKSYLTTTFAILTHPEKQVWPLHIQTIRHRVPSNGDTFPIIGFVLYIVSGIGLAFGGCLLYFCRDRVSSKAVQDANVEQVKMPSVLWKDGYRSTANEYESSFVLEPYLSIVFDDGIYAQINSNVSNLYEPNVDIE